MHLGIQESTSRIKHVRDMLAKRRKLDQLTPIANQKWINRLEHNRADVKGMRDLVLKAVSGFVPMCRG